MGTFPPKNFGSKHAQTEKHFGSSVIYKDTANDREAVT
jgi:hypothetical protein